MTPAEEARIRADEREAIAADLYAVLEDGAFGRSMLGRSMHGKFRAGYIAALSDAAARIATGAP